MNPSFRDIVNFIIDKLNKEKEIANQEIYYLEFNRLLKIALGFDIDKPKSNQKKMTEKSEKAKYLISIGYSVRETMRIMGYKSPKSIQDLLKR